MTRADADPLVVTEERSGIRVLRISRPPVNALNLETVRAIAEAIARLREDPCRGVVLTGLPGSFCAGLDTREVPAYDAAQRAELLHTINRTMLALYGLAKPVVTAVSGHAIGAGFVMMLTGDARFAAAGQFTLGLTESAAGIAYPAGPLTVVRAELSPSQIRTLALSSLTAAPDSPAFAGLLDEVVAPAALLDRAVARASDLAAMRSFAQVKRQLRAPAVQALRQIVENDEEPLLKHWI